MSSTFGDRGGFDGCRIEREERRWTPSPAITFSSVSPTRHVAIRIIWSLVAVLTGLAALGFTIGGAFAPADMERIYLGMDRSYHVNAFRFMFFLTSVLAPLSMFCTWKATHRGGLSFWRSTARPAILAASGTLMASGLTFSSFIAAGGFQLIGLVTCAAASCVFFVVWMLRGPRFEPFAGDGYWNRAFAVLFAISALGSSAATIHGWRHWSHEGRVFAIDTKPFRTVEVAHREWDGFRDRYVESPVAYRVPQRMYNLTPLASWLLGLLSVGCFAEMRYRLKLAGQAGG